MEMNRSIARSLIYNTLSLCYTYPNEEVYRWLLETEWIHPLHEALDLLNEERLKTLLFPLEQWLLQDREEKSLEMAREYTRLFINAFPHVVAPPYGSVYLEKEGLVYGWSTTEVLRFYHEAGFSLKKDLGDLPDHIAHELEFMGILAGKESEAAAQEKIHLEETQMHFLSRFIFPWVPTFCEKVMGESRSPFYRSLSSLTKEFIFFERNYLGVPEESNSPEALESDNRGG
jgi:TorA maturation chaperone TorD